MPNDEWDNPAPNSVPAMGGALSTVSPTRQWLQSQIEANKPTDNWNWNPLQELSQNVQGAIDTGTNIVKGWGQLVTDPSGWWDTLKENTSKMTPEELAMAFNPGHLGSVGFAGMVKNKGGNWAPSLAGSEFIEKHPTSGYPNMNWMGQLGQHIEGMKSWADGSNNDLISASTDQQLTNWHKWVHGPYMKYLTNQLGTGVENDPLVKIADDKQDPIYVGTKPDLKEDKEMWQRARDLRAQADMPIDLAPTANTELGAMVEEASDSMLRMFRAKDAAPDTTKLFPHMSKLTPDTFVYDLEGDADPSYKTLGLDKIAKQAYRKIRLGLIPENKINNYTVETAAREIHDYENSGAVRDNRDPKLYADWQKKRMDEQPSHMNFMDGSKMVHYNEDNFDPETTKKDFSSITKDLNNCIGSCNHNMGDYPKSFVPIVEPHTGNMPNGVLDNTNGHGWAYLSDMKRGENQIFALKDVNGKNKVAIEADDAPISPDILFKKYIETLPEDQKKNLLGAYAHSFDSKDFIVDLYNNNSDFNKFIRQENDKGGRYDIRQLSGYGNWPIEPQDTPNIKHWLNTTPIRHIDTTALKNSGLYDTSSSSSMDRFMINNPKSETRFLNALEDAQREKIMEWNHDLTGDIRDAGGNWDMDEQGFPYEHILNHSIADFKAEAQKAGLTEAQARNLYKKYNKLFNQPLNHYAKDHLPRFVEDKDIEEFINKFGY